MLAANYVREEQLRHILAKKVRHMSTQKVSTSIKEEYVADEDEFFKQSINKWLLVKQSVLRVTAINTQDKTYGLHVTRNSATNDPERVMVADWLYHVASGVHRIEDVGDTPNVQRSGQQPYFFIRTHTRSEDKVFAYDTLSSLKKAWRDFQKQAKQVRAFYVYPGQVYNPRTNTWDRSPMGEEFVKFQKPARSFQSILTLLGRHVHVQYLIPSLNKDNKLVVNFSKNTQMTFKDNEDVSMTKTFSWEEPSIHVFADMYKWDDNDTVPAAAGMATVEDVDDDLLYDMGGYLPLAPAANATAAPVQGWTIPRPSLDMVASDVSMHGRRDVRRFRF
jgi:hypothetical protein